MPAIFITATLTSAYIAFKMLNYLVSSGVAKDEPGACILIGVLLLIVVISMMGVTYDTIYYYVKTPKKNEEGNT